MRPCRGVLAIASLAAEHKARALIVPAENAREAMLVRGLAVQPAHSLAEVVSLLREQRILTRPISHQDDPLRQEPSLQPWRRCPAEARTFPPTLEEVPR